MNRALCILTVAVFANAVPGIAGDCAIDATKATSWAQFGTLVSKQTPPVIATYKGCGRTLTYVAAEHSNDLKSPTFTLVKRAFDRAKPKALVLEGFPSQWGENPKPLVEHSKSVANTPGDAEPYFSIRLALNANVKFIGGEPNDSDILAAVKSQGWSADDLFALYVLRQIEQWKRSQEIGAHTDPKLRDSIAQYAVIFARDAVVPPSEFAAVSTLEGFKSWYKRVNGVDFETGYRPEDAWPPSDSSNRKSNAMTAAISDVRDRHILSVIDASLKANGEVMVVYGASHHDIQAPALEASYGAAKYAR